MNIASIFRPSVTKVVLAAIILVIFVPFFIYDNGIRCFTTPCPSESAGTILTYITLNGNHIYSVYYLNLVVGIVPSYIASCMAVFAISKMQKK